MASTSWWRATTASTARSSGSGAPASSTTATGGGSMPASRSSFWSATHIGTCAPGGYSRSRAEASLTASTVGSQTIRAPSRAAISTASGLRPPTAALSVIAPTARTSGTTRLTTRARSAVEV